MTRTYRGEKRVVLYRSSNGPEYLAICAKCEARLLAEGRWPKDSTGMDFVDVMQGRTAGFCSICQPGHDEDSDGRES